VRHGAQGSGKSNLMDAISFVLGVRTAHLRGSLRELLYANSEAGDEGQARRGLVKLVFETGAGEEVEFARVIVPSGGAAAGYASKYRIDGREVRWEDYNARLQSYGILVQARNFLVFQARARTLAAHPGSHRFTGSTLCRVETCCRVCTVSAGCAGVHDSRSSWPRRATSSPLRPRRPRS